MVTLIWLPLLSNIISSSERFPSLNLKGVLKATVSSHLLYMIPANYGHRCCLSWVWKFLPIYLMISQAKQLSNTVNGCIAHMVIIILGSFQILKQRSLSINTSKIGSKQISNRVPVKKGNIYLIISQMVDADKLPHVDCKTI